MEEWHDYVDQDELYYHLEICTQDGKTCECVKNTEVKNDKKTFQRTSQTDARA